VPLIQTQAAHNVDDELVELPEYSYYVGKVMKVKNSETNVGGIQERIQNIEARIVFGEEAGKDISSQNILDPGVEALRVGQQVVIVKSTLDGDSVYHMGEPYRLVSISIIVAVFFALVIFFGRIRGVTSIFGLVMSVVVLKFFIVDRILDGHDPLITTFLGALLIVLCSLYLAHGFNKRTSIAVLGTLLTLLIILVVAQFFVGATALTGAGTEEALFLQFGPLGTINLRGLLLSGIIIGVLGVLDDVTTGQVAAIGEIADANPLLSTRELYRRGLAVGKEHIASLVNTLVLAYAGSSLPLFLLFTIYKDTPFWVTLNSSPIAEEMIRSLVGSTTLVLAVPITTYLAAKFLAKKTL